MDIENKLYPKNTAGRRMIKNVPFAKGNETAKKIILRIRKNEKNYETVNYIYVVDGESLLGIIPIKKLLFAKENALMKDLMRINYCYASPNTNDDEVADLVLKNNIKAVPVLKKGKFLGVVPSDKILTILKNDFSKSIINMSGVHDDVLEYKIASDVPVIESIKLRLPWLIIGLIGITLAAGFINIFEEMLSEHLIIAFFIPAMVYMSGAIASQHQTLFIRDMAMMDKNIEIKKYFFNVSIIGLILGIIIGTMIYFIISFFWKDAFVALIIALSMGTTLFSSSISSFIITYGLSKMKFDPANGSGPFATIISDVSSIMIYFIIVYALFGIMG